MLLSIPDDLQHYYLPIGFLGLINQVANIYIFLIFITGYRPLMPGRPIQRTGYSTSLCYVVMIFTLGFDSTSLSRLSRWELITSTVGNLVLFLSYLFIAALSVGDSRATQVKADLAPQTDAESTLQTGTAHEDQPPPPYSEDPEKGETIIDGQTQASNVGISCSPDHEATGAPEYPVTQKQSKEPEVVESSPTTAEKDATSPLPMQAQTETQTRSQAEIKALVQAQKATETGATLYYLMFNMPGSILVLAGLVGQLVHNLPADRDHAGQIRSIVIAFSIFFVATVLATLVRVLRLMRKPAPSDEELILRKGHNYSDCVLQCGVALSFFIVSFDKWLLAALAGDMTGAKHVLSDGGLPLIYMLVTKLPALAL